MSVFPAAFRHFSITPSVTWSNWAAWSDDMTKSTTNAIYTGAVVQDTERRKLELKFAEIVRSLAHRPCQMVRCSRFNSLPTICQDHYGDNGLIYVQPVDESDSIQRSNWYHLGYFAWWPGGLRELLAAEQWTRMEGAATWLHFLLQYRFTSVNCDSSSRWGFHHVYFFFFSIRLGST